MSSKGYGNDRTVFILANGRDRSLLAVRTNIEHEVEAEYRKLMQEAAWWRRLLLLMKMRQDIRRRLEKVAPRDALYVNRGRD